ncbi:hypothetical protein ID866_6568 [Astraeus odoratus]|nr:hypothetical protein ID866_6568 [Astraeus odoratus]
MIVLMGITVASLDRLPIVSTPYGCAFESLPPITSLFWVPALVVEPILCMLVLWKAIGVLNGRTELSALLARDRILMSKSIFAELTSMLVAWLVDPLYVSFFFPWTIAFPSLFGGRLLLNIRRHFEPPEAPEDIEMAVTSTTLQ